MEFNTILQQFAGPVFQDLPWWLNTTIWLFIMIPIVSLAIAIGVSAKVLSSRARGSQQGVVQADSTIVFAGKYVGGLLLDVAIALAAGLLLSSVMSIVEGVVVGFASIYFLMREILRLAIGVSVGDMVLRMQKPKIPYRLLLIIIDIVLIYGVLRLLFWSLQYLNSTLYY